MKRTMPLPCHASLQTKVVQIKLVILILLIGLLPLPAFGQYVLQGGYATTPSTTTIVQAHYNSETSENSPPKIVQVQYPSVVPMPYTQASNELGLQTPRLLQVSPLPSSVIPQPAPQPVVSHAAANSNTQNPSSQGKLVSQIVPAIPIAPPNVSDSIPIIRPVAGSDGTTPQPTVLTAPMPVPVLSAQVTREPQAYSVPPEVVRATPSRSVAEEAITRNYRIQHISPQQFEKKLTEKLGSRFVPVRNIEATPEISRYRLPVKDGTDVELTINRQNSVASVVGSAQMVASTLQIAQLLDVQEQESESTTEFFPVQGTNLVSVKQAANMINQESAKPDIRTDGTSTAPKLAQNPAFSRPNDDAATARFAAPSNNRRDGETLNVQNYQAAQAEGRGIVGPVQIDLIEGIGTMVIKGNPQDVAAIRNLISQIEQMSLENEPVLELVALKNADSYRINTMVQQLYSQVYVQRHGTVTMIPLIKPNTILIAGKEESVKTAKELIAKLDTPVDPSTEFQIIKLRHASSDTLQQRVTSFYANTNRQNQGLEPKVFVVSDYRTNSLLIQASPRDMAEVLAMVRELDSPGSDASNTVKVFQLKNAMASELATTLQSALSGTSTGGQQFGSTGSSNTSRGHALELLKLDDLGLLRADSLSDVRVVADTRSNAVIVTAPKDSMPLIETLVKQLDQLPTAESQIKMFTLVNGDAYTLTTMLTNIFSQSSSTGGGGFGGGTQSTNQMATRRPGIEGDESTLVSVKFDTDIRTNSILAIGSAGDMAVVEAILLRLDEDNMNNRKVIIFKPMNSRASDIATALQNYATSERTLENQNSTYLLPQSPSEQYRKEIVPIADETTNTLIVSTTPRYFDLVRKLVQELDDRPLMVAIQVLIAEVSLSKNRELGVELGLQDSLLFDRSLLSGGQLRPGFLFGTPAEGLPMGNVQSGTVGSQGVTSLGTGRVGSNGYGGFTFSASSESVSVLVRALEEQGKLRVLSRPQLTTMHNLRGQLQIGQRVPYVTSADSNNSGGMTSSVDFEDVGIILDITPRISPDGMIVMDMFVEKSYVGGDADGIPIYSSGDTVVKSPRINITRAQTTVSAMDGQTIVFAGLITEEKETIERGVPILNKIPVVKHLFEYKQHRCTRSEMLIIMTPVLIRSEADMEMLRMQEASRMNWCISDVVKLTGNSKMRVRGDCWDACEVEYTRVEPVILDDSLLPSEDKIQLQRMFPPTLAPERIGD